MRTKHATGLTKESLNCYKVKIILQQYLTMTTLTSLNDILEMSGNAMAIGLDFLTTTERRLVHLKTHAIVDFVVGKCDMIFEDSIPGYEGMRDHNQFHVSRRGLKLNQDMITYHFFN